MPTKNCKNDWARLALLLAVCFAVAGIGGYGTTPDALRWYSTLAKPSWTPPSWVFGPVWTVLYAAMAVAAWLVWRRSDSINVALAMLLFGVQLLFNGAWSWLFFRLQQPGVAFLDIVFLWLAIAATTVAFWRRSHAAAILFLPYFAWASFAAALNFAVWRMN